MSLEAHGWMGGDTYSVRGVVHTPYPIGFLQKIRIPYKISAFGLRPYPAFISQYYNRLGWVYQRRRTWHGIIYSAINPPISAQPHTAPQEVNKLKFAGGVALWQGLTDAQRHIWNSYPMYKHMSGFNLFLRYYMLNKI